jgi:hypothetical protein
VISQPVALRTMGAALIVVLLLGATASTAYAIPAFARKYQTSCQTCHIVFPKLNAFGEAFRLRGYRMPGETEDMVKQPPVSLGAPAYKKLWPRSVWPGETSSYVPLAINIEMADVNTSSLNEDGTVTHVKNDLQFPKEMAILGAGTLGEHVSYWTEAVLGEQADGSVEVELEQARIAFDSPFGPEDLFHFRIGKFTPNLIDGLKGGAFVSTDAGIDSFFAYNPIGINGGTGFEGTSPSPISLPESVRGIEGYGIIKHRVLWVAGLANGIGPSSSGNFDGNNAKDVYARLDYKIGGMGLDGDTGGKPVPDKNWRDNSLRLGVFTYRGNASDIEFPTTFESGVESTIQDVHFMRTGVYANAFFQDLNVFGAYLHGTDNLHIANPVTGAPLAVVKPDFHALFTQVDYVIYPWLQGAFRYETLTPADRSVQSLRTGVLNLSALIRANVKVMAEYQRDLREGANHSFNVVMRFAF